MVIVDEKWYVRCTIITVKSTREISQRIEGIDFTQLQKISRSSM